MRVLLDFQACQSGSRFRGVGRASKSLLFAMADQLVGRGDEVVFLLSKAFPEEMSSLAEEISARFGNSRICKFSVPLPCAPADEANVWRQSAARLLREHFVASLEPDFQYLPALLADGWGDDAVGSVRELGLNIPTALTQHDLIPLAMPDLYLPPSRFRDYYLKKIEDARHAELFMAISEYSAQEVVGLLGVPDCDVVCISSAAGPEFRPVPASSELARGLFERLGLGKGFLLYAPGGFDQRKNIERLLTAFSELPGALRREHQLVLASKLDAGRREKLEELLQRLGVAVGDVVLTDYVSDEELKVLYSNCLAYVFPSLHEGFGLPALEAMSCGAAVIASNRTGIPEVVGLEEALFDASRVESIREALLRVVADEAYRQRLIGHARLQVGKFCWERSASLALGAMDRRFSELAAAGWSRVARSCLPTLGDMLAILERSDVGGGGSVHDLREFARCFHENSLEASL